MGLFINTVQTQNIVAKLNWKFSDGRLNRIRNSAERLARFDPNKKRTLRRISYQMRLWPGRNQYSNVARKWYAFLLNLEKNEPAIHAAIRAQIWAALSDQDFAAIKFVAVEGSAVDFDYMDLGAGKYKVKLLILTTKAHGAAVADEPGPDLPDEPANERSDPENEDLPDQPAPFKKKAAKKKAAKKKAAKKKAKRR